MIPAYNIPAGTVEFRVEDVVHHAASVADFQATRFDTADCSRTDDGHVFLRCQLVEFACRVFGNALGDDGDGADLRVVHGFHGALVSRPQRSKIDHDVSCWVFLHGVVHRLVDGNEDFAVAPVEFLLVVASERVDHGGH